MARASSPEPSEIWSRPGHEERFLQPWSFRDPASHRHGLEAPCHAGDILLEGKSLWRMACLGVSEQGWLVHDDDSSCLGRRCKAFGEWDGLWVPNNEGRGRHVL